jgi:hypothetical protein
MIIAYTILNKNDFFSNAEEFIYLEQVFKRDNPFEYLIFFSELLYPIISIFKSIYSGTFNMSIFLPIYSLINKFIKYIRYCELYYEIDTWKKLVNLEYDGPLISTNNPRYEPYVYAHTMQRTYNSLLAKKSTKRF